MNSGAKGGEKRLPVAGFPGAYTTFSTFEYETGILLKDGELWLGTLYVILSAFLGFAALKSGQMPVKLF